MPQQFASLGASRDDLRMFVLRTLTEAGLVGVHGRAAIAKLVAAAVFTGFRPLGDPRLAHLREGWLPVRPPRNDLFSVTRMIDGVHEWRRACGLMDVPQLIHAVGRSQCQGATVSAVLSQMSPSAQVQFHDILSAEAQRAGLSDHDAIAAHAEIAVFCGPYFLVDPLQKRLAAIFASPGDIRVRLQAEAGARAERIDHAV